MFQFLFAFAGLLVVGYAALTAVGTSSNSPGTSGFSYHESCTSSGGTGLTTCDGSGTITGNGRPHVTEGEAMVATSVAGVSLIGFAIVLGQMAPVTMKQRSGSSAGYYAAPPTQ